MPSTRVRHPLDDAVLRLVDQLEDRGVPRPRVLFLMATGVHPFAERLEDEVEVELGDLGRVPPPWNQATLFAGRMGPLRAWCLADLSGDPTTGAGPAWQRGLPLWVAARCGATVCVHTSAGSALRSDDEAEPNVPVGGFALIRDHVNLSGETPLTGLGESQLGPLFPDLSLLHHEGLRHAFRRRADKLGLSTAEAVAACVTGPTLETPAERRMLARLGADVSVQSLATPLLAAGHAGLRVLGLVAVTDATGGAMNVSHIVAAAAAAEPAIDDLLASALDDLDQASAALSEERDA